VIERAVLEHQYEDVFDAVITGSVIADSGTAEVNGRWLAGQVIARLATVITNNMCCFIVWHCRLLLGNPYAGAILSIAMFAIASIRQIDWSI
jgi:hypothetical protein